MKLGSVSYAWGVSQVNYSKELSHFLLYLHINLWSRTSNCPCVKFAFVRELELKNHKSF